MLSPLMIHNQAVAVSNAARNKQHSRMGVKPHHVLCCEAALEAKQRSSLERKMIERATVTILLAASFMDLS